MVEACMYYNMDVAIKSYAISFLTGSTFDGFIDCTLEGFGFYSNTGTTLIYGHIKTFFS
jgi:hypothetical protein